MSQMRSSILRTLSMMLSGSSPITSRITPMRMDRRTSRKITESGGPPKKRASEPADGAVLCAEMVGRSEGMLMGS